MGPFFQNKKPKIGDIVIFRYPEDPKKHLIKRIVALGGETIEIIGRNYRDYRW
ncbi:MAG: hypothetical protein GY705_16265 [Bacteroidetes bacterium]|nr:hypothetical protein [Bacteroidota bacterium]